MKSIAYPDYIAYLIYKPERLAGDAVCCSKHCGVPKEQSFWSRRDQMFIAVRPAPGPRSSGARCVRPKATIRLRWSRNLTLGCGYKHVVPPGPGKTFGPSGTQKNMWSLWDPEKHVVPLGPGKTFGPSGTRKNMWSLWDPEKHLVPGPGKTCGPSGTQKNMWSLWDPEKHLVRPGPRKTCGPSGTQKNIWSLWDSGTWRPWGILRFT